MLLQTDRGFIYLRVWCLFANYLYPSASFPPGTAESLRPPAAPGCSDEPCATLPSRASGLACPPPSELPFATPHSSLSVSIIFGLQKELELWAVTWLPSSLTMPLGRGLELRSFPSQLGVLALTPSGLCTCIPAFLFASSSPHAFSPESSGASSHLCSGNSFIRTSLSRVFVFCIVLRLRVIILVHHLGVTVRPHRLEP